MGLSRFGEKIICFVGKCVQNAPNTAGNYLLFVDVWYFRFHTHEGVKNGQPLDVAASNGGAKAVIFVMISQLQQESQTKSTRTP